jgi:hypothetical protein
MLLIRTTDVLEAKLKNEIGDISRITEAILDRILRLPQLNGSMLVVYPRRSYAPPEKMQVVGLTTVEIKRETFRTSGVVQQILSHAFPRLLENGERKRICELHVFDAVNTDVRIWLECSSILDLQVQYWQKDSEEENAIIAFEAKAAAIRRTFGK